MEMDEEFLLNLSNVDGIHKIVNGKEGLYWRKFIKGATEGQHFLDLVPMHKSNLDQLSKMLRRLKSQMNA